VDFGGKVTARKTNYNGFRRIFILAIFLIRFLHFREMVIFVIGDLQGVSVD